MKRWIAVLITSLYLLIGVQVSFAQESTCIDYGGVWDAESERCLLKANLDINLAYPLVAIETPFIAEIIDTWYSQMRADYSMWFSQQPLSMTVANQWFVNVSYAEYRFSPDFVSLVFTVSDYTGGAHPNSYFNAMTFDLAQSTPVTLDDVLTEGALPQISALVQTDLVAQLTELMGGAPDTDWITTGTGDNVDNFANFALSEDALIFFFPPYQVAAYAAGSFTVSLDLADIQNLLQPAFQ